MDYEITLTKYVNFAPRTEVEEILQNCRTIISTLVGTVPLNRGFGVTWDHLDKPLPIARARMREAVIDAIHEHEPRAVVRSVRFDENIDDVMEGIIRPRVVVTIGEDEEDEL